MYNVWWYRRFMLTPPNHHRIHGSMKQPFKNAVLNKLDTAFSSSQFHTLINFADAITLHVPSKSYSDKLTKSALWKLVEMEVCIEFKIHNFSSVGPITLILWFSESSEKGLFRWSVKSKVYFSLFLTQIRNYSSCTAAWMLPPSPLCSGDYHVIPPSLSEWEQGWGWGWGWGWKATQDRGAQCIHLGTTLRAEERGQYLWWSLPILITSVSLWAGTELFACTCTCIN